MYIHITSKKRTRPTNRKGKRATDLDRAGVLQCCECRLQFGDVEDEATGIAITARHPETKDKCTSYTYGNKVQVHFLYTFWTHEHELLILCTLPAIRVVSLFHDEPHAAVLQRQTRDSLYERVGRTVVTQRSHGLDHDTAALVDDDVSKRKSRLLLE